MFSFGYAQMNETADLYTELNSLSVDENKLIFFLTHPDEREKVAQGLLQYQSKLNGSRVDPATKETFSEAAQNYLGRLNTLKEALRNGKQENSGMGDFLTGAGIGLPIGFVLGSLWAKGLYENLDEKAREDAYRIITEMQKYQASAQVPPKILDYPNIMPKIEQINSDSMKFFERLKEIEEKLNKGGEVNGSKQSTGSCTGRSRGKTVHK